MPTYEEAKRLGGRVNDPAEAPNIPTYFTIEGDRSGFRVMVSGWNRSKDRIVEFHFTAAREGAELVERDVTPEDAEWLRNIGARD